VMEEGAEGAVPGRPEWNVYGRQRAKRRHLSAQLNKMKGRELQEKSPRRCRD
jgi:hypothetical protein